MDGDYERRSEWDMSGIIQLVHRADDPDGPFRTISEVAEFFEVHIDTARRWAKACGLPKRKMELNEEGTSWVWLYNEEDMDALSEYSGNLKPGRPKNEQ